MRRIVPFFILLLVLSFTRTADVQSSDTGISAVAINFAATEGVYYANFSVSVSGGTISSLVCGAGDYVQYYSDSDSCIVVHNGSGTTAGQLGTVYVSSTSSFTVSVTGQTLSKTLSSIDNVVFTTGSPVTQTPTGEPTVAAGSPTPTTVPGPSEVVISIPRKTSQPSEFTSNTSAGDVMVRCESVYDGGRLMVKVLSTPPGSLAYNLISLKTNFDLSAYGLGCTTMTVCLPYLDSELSTAKLSEGELAMFQYHNGVWSDVSSYSDPATNKICGRPAGFSPFILGKLDVPPTATLNPDAPTSTLAPTVPDDSTPTPTGLLPKSGATGTTLTYLLSIIGVVGLGILLIL